MLEERFAQIYRRPWMADLLRSAREGNLCMRVEEELDTSGLPVVQVDGRLYLEQHWHCEQAICKGLKRLLEMQVPPVEIAMGEGLLPEQAAAIRSCADSALTLITGGPGTGKTYTAGHLIEAIGAERLALAAPTGKAAGNLARATGRQVQTLHALLRKEEWHPADLILVDEASMIDAKLMARLLSAVKEGGRLVLMGDPDQLPPVEAGSIFADMVQAIGAAELKTCVRVENPKLLELASAIREGRELPELEWIKDPIAYARGESVGVLCPTRVGTQILNEKLKRPGPMPIIICRNDYQLELFNGDMGLLDGGVATFGERRVEKFLLPKYEPAYALSVHKSQGSEFDRVLLVLPDECEHFGRELLYTAVTRAKRGVALFGSEEQLSKMMARKISRLSGLQECIASLSNSSSGTGQNISASSSASPLHLC